MASGAGQSWRVNAFGGDPGHWWVDTPVPSLVPRVPSGVSPVCPQGQWAWCHLVLTALPPTHCPAPSSDSCINVHPGLSVRQTRRPCSRKHLGQNGLLRDTLLPPFSVYAHAGYRCQGTCMWPSPLAAAGGPVFSDTCPDSRESVSVGPVATSQGTSLDLLTSVGSETSSLRPRNQGLWEQKQELPPLSAHLPAAFALSMFCPLQAWSVEQGMWHDRPAPPAGALLSLSVHSGPHYSWKPHCPIRLLAEIYS